MFQLKHSSSLGILLAIAGLSSTLISCSQAKTESARSSSTTTISSQSQPSLVRLGYQKGSTIPISRQRGELEKELTAQQINVEWDGPFDRCASLMQAMMGGRTDIGGCGDIPAISGIAAGQSLCIGAVQPPNPGSLESGILVKGDSTIQ